MNLNLSLNHIVLFLIVFGLFYLCSNKFNTFNKEEFRNLHMEAQQKSKLKKLQTNIDYII